jgi:DNA-binding NarL/FixJ family response regulator
LEVAGEAGDGVEALEVARSARFDVALVDIRMPRLDGIETTRRLRALPDPPAVVVLTSFDVDRYVYEAVHAGACGFLLKDAPEEQLLAAVRSAREGVALFDARVTVRLVERFAPRSPVASPALGRLTPRELTLLLELASGSSNASIGARLHISEATVKTHVSRILAKLGLQTRVQAVVLAYESGLVDRP